MTKLTYIAIILLFACCSHNHTEDCIKEVTVYKTRVSTDSLLILADKVKQKWSNQQIEQHTNLDSIEGLLLQEVDLYNSAKTEYNHAQSQYQEQLHINEDLVKPTTRKIYKDTVIWNKIYKDTLLYKRDTVYITDTIYGTFWKRRKDRN